MDEKHSVQIREPKKVTAGRRVLRTLSSVKLTVSLLTVVAVIHIVATIIKTRGRLIGTSTIPGGSFPCWDFSASTSFCAPPRGRLSE